MTKIIWKEDCGNSPRRRMLKDWLVAFAHGDIDSIVANLADDVVWTVVGGDSVSGKAPYEEAITEMIAARAVKELVIDTIITHGAVGSANGSYTTATGETYGFCDVYTFASAASTSKVKQITSYFIEIR